MIRVGSHLWRWRSAFTTFATFAAFVGAAGTLDAQRDSSAVGASRDSAAGAAGVAGVAGVAVPVVLDADTLFRLYGNLGPFSPAARANVIAARIREASRAIVAGDSVSVVDRGPYSELVVGDIVLMTVLDEDARPVGVARSVLAQRYAAKIRSAALAAAERRSIRALLRGALYAGLATAVLLLLLWLLAVASVEAHGRIEALRVRFSAVKIQHPERSSSGRLSSARLSPLLLGAVRFARIMLIVLLLYVYVPLVLGFFPWTSALSQHIRRDALHPFAAAWAGFVSYLPNLFFVAAGIIIVRYALALMHVAFDAVGRGTITIRGFYTDWAEPTYRILRILVFAFAAVILYPYLPGASSDAFKGVSIFVGVLFSLGSSSAIGNMVAGVVLTYTRAFQIGDRVKIGQTEGDVTEKTLLVTRLRTIKNVAVTIPNGTVLAGDVVNYTTLSATHGLVLSTTVPIGYAAPWRQVEELLVQAARRTEHILSEPAPFVLQTSLSDTAVSYELNAVTDRADLMAATYSSLHRNIQETFNASGVEIMSPESDAPRDGDQMTAPATYLSPEYRAPAFRTTGARPGAAQRGDPAPE